MFFGKPLSFFILVAITSVVTSNFVVPFLQRQLAANRNRTTSSS